MDNEQLVKSIRQLCKNRNIAISQLENDLNFGAGLISRWSKNSPSIDKIVDIADYFHVAIDEVVGRNNIVDDKFLEKLVSQTENNTLIWLAYNDDNNPPKYDPPLRNILESLDSEEGEIYRQTHQDLSYYTKINNGYISIYGYYEYQDILNPKEIKLFIQADNNAQLIEQNYSYDQLKVLWLKVISTRGDKAPDEIKVEEFKNNFINNQYKSRIDSYSEEQLKQITKNMIEIEPQLPKLFDAINDPDFTKVLNMMQYPDLQRNLELAQKLSPYYAMIVDEQKKTP